MNDTSGFDFQRLLEKKWSDLKHIETERHWILASYAVISVGVLTSFEPLYVADATHVAGYSILAILGFFGWVHAMRAAWILFLVQNDIDDAARNWASANLSRSHEYILLWGFSTGKRGRRSKLRWFLRQYLIDTSRKPWVRFHLVTFTAVYIWIYTLAVLCLLKFAIICVCGILS